MNLIGLGTVDAINNLAAKIWPHVGWTENVINSRTPAQPIELNPSINPLYLPDFVALLYFKYDRDVFRFKCHRAVISKRWIITSAICLFDDYVNIKLNGIKAIVNLHLEHNEPPGFIGNNCEGQTNDSKY